MADRHTRVTVNETSSQEGDCEPDSTVCGLRDVLDRIGDTWSVLVIIQLRLHGRRALGSYCARWREYPNACSQSPCVDSSGTDSSAGRSWTPPRRKSSTR